MLQETPVGGKPIEKLLEGPTDLVRCSAASIRNLRLDRPTPHKEDMRLGMSVVV